MKYLLFSKEKPRKTEDFSEITTKGEKSENLRLSCALGCFDGVHKGHRALIAAAQKENYVPAIWTFSKPLSANYIDPVWKRLEFCGKAGAKAGICEDFEKVQKFSPEQFVSHMVKDFNVYRFVCGEDFRFGYKRQGDILDLKTEGAKFGAEVEVLKPLTYKDGQETKKISSTFIREMIKNGDFQKANELLCRNFSLEGKVVEGKQIGRTISLPTVNITLNDGRILPRNGVYNTVCVISGVKYPSVTNIGYRPTVNLNENDITCETHIIDLNMDLYGENVTVEFLSFAREERKFSSLEELKSVVMNDIVRRKNI